MEPVGTIRVICEDEMVSIVCELVKKGFMFHVRKDCGYYVIELTGGF